MSTKKICSGISHGANGVETMIIIATVCKSGKTHFFSENGYLDKVEFEIAPWVRHSDEFDLRKSFCTNLNCIF